MRAHEKHLSRFIFSIALVLTLSEHVLSDQRVIPSADEDNFIISVKPGLGEKPIKVNLDKKDRNCNPEEDKNKKPREGDYIGLALSGGISKGFAHIGALQFLDQLGIRVDGIAGTSFGAIVGALYAAGYSPDQIEEIVTEDIEWQNVFTDIPSDNLLDANRQIMWGLDGGNNIIPRLNQDGLRSGQSIYPILNKFLLRATMIAGNCFDQLYIPFRATAINLSSEHINDSQNPLDSGNLVNAVKASFAFPVIFSPVFIEGKRYRDGGIQKNLPIEDVNKMGQYKIIIAVDTTDDDLPELSPKRMFPFVSVSDVIDEGMGSLGTALTQEVYRQTEGIRKCKKEDLTNLYASNGSKETFPCLIHIKIDLKGGFLDFEKGKIKDAIARGFKNTAKKICELAAECKPVEDQGEDDQKQKQVMEFIKQCCIWKGKGSPKESRNHDAEKVPVDELKKKINMGDRVFSGSDLKNVTDASDKIKELEKLYNEEIQTNSPSRVPWTDIDHDKLGENIFQGVKLTYGPGQSLMIHVDGKLDPSQEKTLVTESLPILVNVLNDVKRNGLEDVKRNGSKDLPFSSAKIISNNGTMTVKLYSWRYPVEKAVFRTDFTEKGKLESPSEILFGFQRNEIDKEVNEIKKTYEKKDYEINLCESGKELPEKKLRGLKKWKNRIFFELKKNQFQDKNTTESGNNAFILKLQGKGNSRCLSLEEIPESNLDEETKQTEPKETGLFLNDTLEEYYANGQLEYVRVENVERSKIVLSEKTNYSDSGMLYFNYHFDTENEHTFSSKHAIYNDDTDTFYQTSVALLDRFQEGDGGNANGIYAGLFTNVFGHWKFGGTTDIYYAKRVQNIRNEGDGRNDFSQLMYYQSGIRYVTVSREDERLSSARKLGYFPYSRLELYKISRVGFNHDPSDDSSRIEDGADLVDKRMVFKYGIGVKNINFTNVGFESYDYSVTGILSSGDLSPSFFGLYESRKDRGWSWNVVGGAIVSEKEEKLPISELYSIGGYYPLREAKIWGGNRFDFIGSGLNEEWGRYLFLLGIRYPLCYYQGLKMIHRNWDTSLSFVADFGNTANTVDKLFDRTNLGVGLDLSLYLPIISALQPKFNAAYGIDRSNYSHDDPFFKNFTLYFSASILL